MDDTLNLAEQAEPMDALEGAETVEEQASDSPLSEVLAEPSAKDEQPPATEPGWIKGRISKAVDKAVAEALAQERAKTEEMLAPIRESILERKAQELVDSGEVKSLELAKELVTLRSGKAPVAKESSATERNDKGQFAPKSDTESAVKARLLVEQAKRIKDGKGLDVMEVYNSDPDVRAKVLSGEWDFHDVAEHMATRRHVPAPMHSPNGGQVNTTSIADMSAAAFKRLDENLALGKSYDMRQLE